MSTALVLALYLFLAPPLALAFFGRRLKWAAGAFYLALGTGVAAYHLEITAPDLPRIERPVRVAENPATDPRCAKALELATQANIILDRKDPAKLVVSAQLWAQVPEEVQDALAMCQGGPAGIEPQIVQR